MGLGPFDLHGAAFLQLYAILLGAAAIAGLLIPRWLRPEGTPQHVTDPDLLGYLAGGSTRFIDTVIVRMLARGQVAVEGKRKLRILAPAGGHGGGAGAPLMVEQAVLALSSPAPWGSVALAVGRHRAQIEQRLIERGLWMDHMALRRLRWLQALPLMLVFAFGAIKWEIGSLRDRPVGFLSLLLVVTIVLALVRFATADPRTRGGLEALAAARSASDRVRRAPTNDEMALAVALFGTAVLAGSAHHDFHALRMAAVSGDAGSSDGGSSDGGGGCGGGGCGGCGS